MKVGVAVAACLLSGLVGRFPVNAADGHPSADEIMRLASLAERLVIQDLSAEVTTREGMVTNGVMVWTELPKPIKNVTVCDRETLCRITASLKLSDDSLRPLDELQTESGEVVVGRVPCQCRGDVECEFSIGNGEVLRFTVHHGGEFIRLQQAGTLQEIDFVPPSGSDFVRLLGEEIKKANQALQTTPIPRSEI